MQRLEEPSPHPETVIFDCLLDFVLLADDAQIEGNVNNRHAKGDFYHPKETS